MKNFRHQAQSAARWLFIRSFRQNSLAKFTFSACGKRSTPLKSIHEFFDASDRVLSEHVSLRACRGWHSDLVFRFLRSKGFLSPLPVQWAFCFHGEGQLPGWARVAKWLTRRPAKPLFMGSIPIPRSKFFRGEQMTPSNASSPKTRMVARFMQRGCCRACRMCMGVVRLGIGAGG